MSIRINQCFERLRLANRPAFIPFITAGDPSIESSLEILKLLPKAGADILEIGIPFSDPMADGKAIQASSLRAINAGVTISIINDMVRLFREIDTETPIVLMGYFNPIYSYGVENFLSDALKAGVDGLIIVDLPPEHDDELCLPATKFGIDFIRLVAPTTEDNRLPFIMKNARGFIYCISVTGITGTKVSVINKAIKTVSRIRKYTDLPVAVGFGIQNSNQAAEISMHADAVVIGSAIVEKISKIDKSENSYSEKLADLLNFVTSCAESIHNSRLK